MPEDARKSHAPLSEAGARSEPGAGAESDGPPELSPEFLAECLERLVTAMRPRMGPSLRRHIDPADIASSAVRSLLRGHAAGKHGDLHEPEEVWRLLATIAARKVCNADRRRRTLRRGGGDPHGDSATLEGAAPAGPACLPELTVIARELLDDLTQQLADPIAEQVLGLRIEGYAVAEIADALGCATRSVERKLERIRHVSRRMSLEE